MSNKVSIPKEELECLREHLNQADKILNSLGVTAGKKKPRPKPKKKVSFKKGVDNYKKLIESGKKRTYPDHLKKKRATR